MSFFSKNKNDGFIINTENDDNKISGDNIPAPYAITPDEISDLWYVGDKTETANEGGHQSALDALKKRMSEQHNAAVSHEPQKTEAEKIEPESIEKPQNATDDVLTDKVNEIKNQTEPPQKETTLLEKMKPYTVDDEGHNLANNSEPLYKLESVAEILKSNSKKYLEKLSKKYDVSVDMLSKKAPKPDAVSDKKESFIKEPKQNTVVPTPAFEKMVDDSARNEEKQILENLFPDEKKAPPADTGIPDISDIDTNESGVDLKSDNTDTATIRFTPIKDNRGNTDHISISNITKHIDLDYDLSGEEIASKIQTPQLDQSEFESFCPDYEITDAASGKKLLRLLAFKKRSLFIGAFISALCTLLMLIFLIPPVSDLIIGKPRGSMITCGALLLISVTSNINMFADFKNIFKKRCTFDISAALCSIFTLALAICAAITYSNAYLSILLCAIILFVRAVCKFKEVSAAINSVRQVIKNGSKNAFSLISDNATTFAMAKNAIEGDVLIAAHRKTEFADDFIKHYSYSARFSGKISFVFLLTVILSAFTWVVALFYFKNVFDAFYCASVITYIAALPQAFMIDALPLSSAAKKINAKGAAIAGIYGAEKIETANAAVVSISDIFPEGTVSMYSMKVLSNNSIDQTILKAASLTAAVNSPLEAIFKKIAGTNSSYSISDSDTVKYEKRLGISGWVDNELLFIGNRSLMKAHAIELPSIEIDKKILRKGYFPVYVATSESACALIVIQYSVRPDIANELRKTTELGITLLVDNCDPNINEEMLCDYFGLYKDSVKIMTNAGVHMYKNATSDVKNCSAPAVFRGSNLSFIKIINCSSMIKKSNRLLTIMYLLSAILGLIYFMYASFSGAHSIPTAFTVLMYELTAAILSIIGFLIRKP